MTESFPEIFTVKMLLSTAKGRRLQQSCSRNCIFSQPTQFAVCGRSYAALRRSRFRIREVTDGLRCDRLSDKVIHSDEKGIAGLSRGANTRRSEKDRPRRLSIFAVKTSGQVAPQMANTTRRPDSVSP